METETPDVQTDETTPQEGATVDAEQTETEDPQEGNEDSFDANRALDKIRKLNSENRNLRDRAHAAEKKGADVEELSKRTETQAAEILRLRVALKHGLPEGLAARLHGSTEEELLADAEDLMTMFEAKRPPSRVPVPKVGMSGTPDVDETVDIPAMVSDVFKH